MSGLRSTSAHLWATFDFVPLFADPRERRGDVALPPFCGPFLFPPPSLGALSDHYAATPHYLEHAQKEYIDKRQGWHVGHSDPGVLCSTPAESRAFCMKLLSRHELHGLREFLQFLHLSLQARRGSDVESNSVIIGIDPASGNVDVGFRGICQGQYLLHLF